MQKLIGIIVLSLIIFSALQSQTKISQDLMKEIEFALGSDQYIDVVLQLQHQIKIREHKTAMPAQTDFSPKYQVEKTDFVTIIKEIKSKSKQEILFSDGPDINGKMYLKAIPAVLFELEELNQVLSLDIAGGVSNPHSNAQSPAEIPYHLQPIQWETGTYQGNSSTGAASLAYSGTIRLEKVPWIRLLFSEANLGNASYIEITSLKDGARQRLNQLHLNQWQYTSAYFNGEGVSIEVYVSPEDNDVFLRMEQITVGEWGSGALLESICGPTDDRIPSNDPAAGRIVPIGCTGWNIISGIHVSAGHCLTSSAQTLEFNVPLSLSSGTIQHPGPDDQYAIDASSKISTNGGIGNDWGVFSVFDNPNTGLQPMVAQGAAFIIAQYYDPDSIRITGYGVDDGTANQTQQTHVGPNAGSSGTTMRYRTDTTGGNSGSPVIDDSTGFAVGVHTHGGCTSSGGNNSGTSTFHVDFWAQVSSAAGIPPVSPSNLSSYSNYTMPTSIELNWEDPTSLVNGDTLLSSEFSIHLERDGVWIDSVLGGVGQYVDGGLNDGQLYEYTVFARLDSPKWESDIFETSWIAGGSPIPNPPVNLAINAGFNEVKLSWVNPTANIDGTPMDDFEALNLYLDTVLVSTLTRSSTDTGMVDSVLYSIPSGEFHYWHVTALDNETPQNESSASNVVITPLNVPKLDYFFSSGLPDSTIWRSVDADINDRSVDPPSGPYALNLNGKPNGADSLELYPTDLSGYAGSGLIFSYAYQPQGQGNRPEPEDTLKLEFLNSQGEWILVRYYEGSTVQPFMQEQIDMEYEPSGSGSFLHSQFQLRISSRGLPSVFTPNDDWFVDNIYLGLPVGVGLVSSDSLFFDTTQVGSSTSEDLWVTNQGFDSLRVNDVLTTNGVFSVNPSNFVLGVGDSLMLQVEFTPSQGGAETGWLRMLNDGVVDTLDVYVEGIGEGPTGIVGDASLPRRFDLSQNYPNPFNPVTQIHYELPRGSEVTLTVYNLLGQKVRTLVSGYQGAGRYDVSWRGDNDLGHTVGSGVYIYRFEAGDYQRTLKMILMK